MIIACDFDNTICGVREVGSEYKMGAPEPGAILALNKLVEDGNTIIIFTAREVNKPNVYKAVEDWCQYFHIPHSGITNIKNPKFDVYIDDRCLHFTDWQQMVADLAKFEQGLEVKNYVREPVKPLIDVTQPL
jgi:hypothetical protein